MGCLLAVGLLVSGTLAATSGSPPVETRVLERARIRLTQIDVTASGPPEVLAALTAQDFKVKIAGRPIETFQLDAQCESTPGGAATSPDAAEAALDAPARPVSFVFYYDQTQMTLGGRQRSLDLTRTMLPLLIRGGSRGMIVSNAGRLSVIEPMTDDTARLLEAVERLEHDRTQWDVFITGEDERVNEVVDVLNEDDIHQAVAMARRHQREERWRSDKALRRLAMTLGRLTEAPSPKAVLYFADALRSNAGEHYLTFFGTNLVRNYSTLSEMRTDSSMGVMAFDRVINESVSQGIRFYPVRARGLVTPFDRSSMNLTGEVRGGAAPRSAFTRHRDSQRTMDNLARETGGRSFLDGGRGADIATTILGDFSCMFVISFDPSGLPEDAPLRATVRSRRDDVRLRTRGRIVVQSASSAIASRLRGALLLGAAGEAGLSVRAGLVAIGFEDGAYRALLQISVPGTSLAAPSWDIGASLVHRDVVRDEVSGRLSVSAPGIPLVFEQELEMRPGLHEVVALAHETTIDLVLSDSLAVNWPDPDAQKATSGPIALLQPGNGAFSRAGELRSSGSWVLADADTARVDRPMALMGLVCRARRHKGAFRIERSLVGSDAVAFPLLEFDLAEDRCAQVRDLIPADMLQPGVYRYRLEVIYRGETIARSSRGFRAAAEPPRG